MLVLTASVLAYLTVLALALAHLEMRLLEDSRQLSRAVVFNLEAVDVAQDLCHQLDVIVLHRFQLHFLQLLLSLGETKKLRKSGKMAVAFHNLPGFVGIYLDVQRVNDRK